MAPDRQREVAPGSTSSSVSSPRHAAVLSVLLLAANAPLAIWAAAFSARGAGDARTHARMAAAIARHGLSHGWTDAYGAGFPLGLHYPLVHSLVAALLVKAGLAPMVALDVLGLLAVLAAPFAVLAVGLRAGARPSAALAAALVVSWVTPGGYFVGGYEAFYGLGLFSQAMVIPFVVLLAGAVARRGPFWHATAAAVLATLLHPQIAVAAALVMSLPVALSRDRGALERYLRAGVAMGLVGAAVYGPGIATLKLPFGWPPMEAWRTIGFGPDHLRAWFFDGELLDVNRPPILTALWVGSLLVVLARLGRPLPRAAALASTVTVTLAVSGGALLRLGRAGSFLLSFLQPLRVLALVPLVAAFTVLVAIEEAAPVVAAVYGRAVSRLAPAARSRLERPWVAAAVPLALFAAVALPGRFAVAELVSQKVLGILGSFPANDACGPPFAAVSTPRPVKGWVASLSGGRLWYDDTTPRAVECEFATGFEIDSRVPIAVTSGVGAHVGVLELAFHQLAPTRAGSARRAEALGVRHVLLFDGPPKDPGWTTTHAIGDIVMADRVGGTDLVGVGCITTRWSGSNAALERRLFAGLATPEGADLLLHPNALVALEITRGRVSETPRDPGDCSSQGAVVTERPREPGAVEADIDAPAPIDVVLRVTAFPTWRVLVDGRPTPTTTVAPGFPSVRVGAGRHHVEAVVAPLPGYLVGVLLALLCAGLCSWPRRRRTRA